MSWPEIKAAYKKLQAVDAEPIEGVWNDFCATVRRSAATPPYHLAILLQRIEHYRDDRASDEITILDHGCGGGLTLLYLIARGFTDIHGVDVGGDLSMLNRITTEILHHQSARFRIYDGTQIPLPDESIDIVFSQQVLEHVTDALIDSYYAEERRVLKPAGWAIHQVPHRLAPYDSHTRTWFIHYLPRPLHRAAGRLIGVTIPDYLYLRWPWLHRRALKAHIGSCQDLTLERLWGATDMSVYEGPVKLRRLAAVILALPLVGSAAGAVLRQFAMLETLSIRAGGAA